MNGVRRQVMRLSLISTAFLVIVIHAAGQPADRYTQSVATSAEFADVSYKAIAINPFDGFTSLIGLGILDFAGPDGQQTDLSVKLYQALKSSNQSYRIFPFPTIRAEQTSLGLESLKPTNKEVLRALEKELSVDFVITGAMTDEADSAFTMQLIRCAGGITVFSHQFRSSITSSALNDAVRFLVHQEVPMYVERHTRVAR
ncbi:MAG: hypothetical protein AB1428_08965 [Bacteroidota bacterium]